MIHTHIPSTKQMIGGRSPDTSSADPPQKS